MTLAELRALLYERAEVTGSSDIGAGRRRGARASAA
jgi:hypothetical protein